ncbi:MFS transporter [Novosphingobium sp.]|uniref:MFS transporter n=1 Tax=Novosphingobium sp. TaxID=1874826 RepID=UPI002B4A5C33|nr:MFS transporter [Novosphingobium sp.]HKR93617.1 MFS transporter [Novosphingobium sp.]
MDNKTLGSEEWKSHWPLVLTAFLGMSYPAIAYYSIGLFIEPLSRDFGWSRTEIAVGASISAIVTIPIMPLVGALVDRWGVRFLALPGTVLTAACISSFALANGNLTLWGLLWGFFALCQAFLKTTIWTAAVMSRFVAARSLAIAITLCGASFANIVVPPLARWLIEDYGWRTSYIALGVGWGIPVFLLCMFFLFDGHDDRRQKKQRGVAGQVVYAHGLSIRQALRSGPILRIGGATLITLLLTACLVVHQVPLLVEAGLSRALAAYLASLSGFGAIAGSLISGWLMDRYHAGWVGAITNALAALALVLLLEPFRTPALIVVAMLVIGYTSGMKLQLCGYLTSVYAGLRNYGKIFGVMASIIAISSALGPMLGGVIYDTTGSYSLFIWAAIPATLFSSFLLLGLGRYPDWAATGEGADTNGPVPAAS